jgi:acyl carrier protein
MTSATEIRAALMPILTELDLLDSKGELVPLDSMAAVLLAVEIERRIVPVPEQELMETNFDSIDTVVAMIERLGKG